jgi:hypothetical protein
MPGEKGTLILSKSEGVTSITHDLPFLELKFACLRNPDFAVAPTRLAPATLVWYNADIGRRTVIRLTA